MNSKLRFLSLFFIGLLQLALLFVVFNALSNQAIFEQTLGKLTDNYVRFDDENGMQVRKENTAYNSITENNLTTWYADIYKVISERMYIPEEANYGQVRGALFPLFPLLWKLSNSSIYSISIINYLLFISGIAFLIITLYHSTFFNQLIAFLIASNLPSMVIYLIPYSEALFLFTAAIGFYGIIKKVPLLYFVGFMLMAMVRPATLFVALAVVFTELCLLFYHKNVISFFKNIALKTLPFLLGYLAVILLQYYYSGSFYTYIDAQKYWAGSIQLFSSVSDWSIEGFALSTFAIFGVCLPAAIVFLYLFFGKGTPSYQFKNNLLSSQRSYLLLISIFYLVGLLIFTLITSGGNLHSFYRFILASPFFYASLFLGIDYLPNKKTFKIEWSYLICMVIVLLFLFTVEFGGTRFQFSFVGLLLFIFLGSFLLVKNYLSTPLTIFLTALLILFCAVWNTYLYNMYLSDGWIFT